ncbi:MAG: hypothetical protein LBL24_01085 [Bacteroidales bacterium]|jgi:hypothetical protein|nr:hypothetical protein [Bacteroidales bacterium]
MIPQIAATTMYMSIAFSRMPVSIFMMMRPFYLIFESKITKNVSKRKESGRLIAKKFTTFAATNKTWKALIERMIAD